MGILKSLNREQKEAVGLLQIGTFLEYFDLMLYVHMAVVLNELFFPETDPHTASLVAAFAFCSTFVLRPFGALIFGYIGDRIGRKTTVIFTTMMMSTSCIIMANLPTYAQVGIVAAWVVTICRMIQGMSSMGEIVGAEIYLTEVVKPPLQYPVVMMIAVASILGGVFALALASLFTSYGFNWRYAFWVGTVIALVGALARTTLKETVDFADAKRRLKKTYDEAHVDSNVIKYDPLINEKASNKTLLLLFALNCEWPICFYFAYMYCGDILKNSFGYTADNVIQHNFIVALVQLAAFVVITCLSYRIHPLKIIKTKLTILFIFMLFCPYLLNNLSTPIHLFMIQSFVVSFFGAIFPGMPILFKHLPVFKRFTYSSFVYALSRALMYIVTSFGIIYLTEYFGHYGILLIMLPTSILCYFGIHHFESLEQQTELRNNRNSSSETLVKSLG
jgi:MFS family permease